MQTSILIVSKNRKQDLSKTIQLLETMLNFSESEILVFLDGCTDDSSDLKNKFTKVRWFESEKSIGASAARHFLYPNAKGQYWVGLDDDAHPLNTDFANQVKNIFNKYSNVGIIAFQEIKGLFDSDKMALESVSEAKEEYLTTEFIGCGFAIRKEVYQLTNGFPVWIDIYGEESCVAIEVLAQGYDILYSNAIIVNHRVDKVSRNNKGQNYFRFGKQLKNITFYYLVYYKFPFFKIIKLYWHNFKKYALLDVTYLRVFFKVILQVLVRIPFVLKYRKPINKNVFDRMKELTSLKY